MSNNGKNPLIALLQGSLLGQAANDAAELGLGVTKCLVHVADLAGPLAQSVPTEDLAPLAEYVRDTIRILEDRKDTILSLTDTMMRKAQARRAAEEEPAQRPLFLAPGTPDIN